MKKLKQKLVNWLLKDVVVDELKVQRIRVGSGTTIVTGSCIDFPGLTSDPTLAAGRVWFRSDLKKFRFSPDGSTVKEF